MVPVEAQLLLPSRIDIRSMGRVTADIVQYHSTTKKNGKPSGPYLENATEDLDAEGKVNIFSSGSCNKIRFVYICDSPLAQTKSLLLYDFM